jgi:nucleoside-diphosphate-sugar epimerase
MREKYDVIVVGGAGYVGQGVCAALRQQGRKPHVIDCHALTDDAGGIDIRDCDPEGFVATDVIWLATLHDTRADQDLWRPHFSQVMSYLPLAWLHAGHRLTYVSSMRARTHPKTLYGFTKLYTEQALLGAAENAWRVIRPGTVWGGFDRCSGPAMRIHTVINRIICGLTPEYYDNVPFYHTQYNRIAWAAASRMKERDYGTITNVVDGVTSAEELRDGKTNIDWLLLNAQQVLADRLVDRGRLDLSAPHPMIRYKEYYNV